VKLALLVALAACSRSEPNPIEPKPAPIAPLVPPSPGPDAALAVVIPSGARELVTVIVDDWDSTKATLQRWHRDGSTWRKTGEPWPGVIGKSGAGWGVGLHGSGAPTGRSGPTKREGDGKSPAGVFALGSSYGYAKAPPAGTKLAYTALDDAWKCVDDPASRNYNRILDDRTVTVDWKSAEDMRRKDELYTWVVDVGHNPAHSPGAGSCIFLHVWRGTDSFTVGCTAMSEPKLAELISTLDPTAVFVLLPRAEYTALAPAWRLP
jgi:L,D-peptidoglycan transpeptidase YkuD (ErfK/YbiS/YcfS/YnhG family)